MGNSAISVPFNSDLTTLSSGMLLRGPILSRPAASVSNAYMYYFATDETGGTLYQNIVSAGPTYTWTQVAASVLSPAGAELAYTSTATSLTNISTTTLTDTGLSVTFDPGTRPAYIEAYCPQVQNSTAGNGGRIAIVRTSDSTILNDGIGDSAAANAIFQLKVVVRIPAGAGNLTYKLQYAARVGGTATFGANAARIIVLRAIQA